MDTSKLQAIIEDQKYPVRERQLRVNQTLHSMGEAGIRLALEAVRAAHSEPVAAMAANFLAHTPGYYSQKDELLRDLITEQTDKLTAAANLIQDASQPTAQLLLEYLLTLPKPKDQISAVFELALHFPDKVRPHHSALEDCDIFEQVLPGAPDEWVESLAARYQADPREYWLFALGQIRTDSARATLIDISKQQEPSRQIYIYALLEAAGVFPDTRLASTYPQSYRGYTVEGSGSPHVMGLRVNHPVPQCPVSQITAECVLFLDCGQLHIEFESPNCPSFFWYEGQHPPGSVYMVFGEEGPRCIMTGDAEQQTRELFPEQLALQLVPKSFSRGRGGNALPGFAQHQVGGFPHLIYPERFPRCPLCNQGMKFLASIDSGITIVAALQFSGTLYCFWCDECSVACTVAQTVE